jgi:hypothetical protein
MNLTTVRASHKENEKPLKTIHYYAQNKNNVGQSAGFLFDKGEYAFAATHLKRIKNLGIRSQDVVLVAIPMRENSWLEVIEAWIYVGADFVLTDPALTDAGLIEMIREEKVTVLATTPPLWKHLPAGSNALPGDAKSIRVIIFNDSGEPNSRYYPLPEVLSGKDLPVQIR